MKGIFLAVMATINAGNFAKGNYVAKLHTTQGVMTKKFVVE